MPPQEPAQNYYDLLGVRPSASTEEIRRRYKFLVVAFHPDRFVRTPEHHALAELRIKQVNEAYRVLSDPQARAQYDMLRLALAGSHSSVGGPAPSVAAPWLAQMQHELEQAHTRITQLEQEVGGWRARLDAATGEKVFLQQERAERERHHEQERQELEAEIGRLTGQLEHLVRERAALDTQLREQATQANQKTILLAQELASRERLVENLAATKAEWEKSNQTRQDLLAQQVRKLQEELARRESALAKQNQAYSTLQERLARVEHEARLAQQSMTHTLRGKQQEVDNLLATGNLAAEARGREQRSVRLWQIAAIIAVLNTLLLLALLLTR
jgi:curved DNA-binding protein CbpA